MRSELFRPDKRYLREFGSRTTTYRPFKKIVNATRKRNNEIVCLIKWIPFKFISRIFSPKWKQKLFENSERKQKEQPESKKQDEEEKEHMH